LTAEEGVMDRSVSQKRTFNPPGVLGTCRRGLSQLYELALWRRFSNQAASRQAQRQRKSGDDPTHGSDPRVATANRNVAARVGRVDRLFGSTLEGAGTRLLAECQVSPRMRAAWGHRLAWSRRRLARDWRRVSAQARAQMNQARSARP